MGEQDTKVPCSVPDRLLVVVPGHQLPQGHDLSRQVLLPKQSLVELDLNSSLDAWLDWLVQYVLLPLPS